MSKKEELKQCPNCGNFIFQKVKICPNCNTKLKTKLSKVQIILIVVCAFIGFSILISAFSNSTDTDSASPADNNSKGTPQSNTTVVDDAQNNDSATMGERMALQSAKNYLRTMGFSKKGLIKQLEFEGYTTEEATYAVNNCGADWKEQAVRVAKNYLNTMPFSRDQLIQQLEFEGFTTEEATHGVNVAYN